MSYTSTFLKIGNHDDGVDVLFPDHPPEVINGAFHWSLSCDEFPL